jgi:hypothetical protein
MRIIKIDYCNHCPFYKTEMEEKEVSKNYKGIFVTDEDENKKYIQEGKAYCLEKKKGYIILIKNLGKELFELDIKLSIKMDKQIENDYDLFQQTEDKLFNDYEKELKIDIPDWCPLEELKEK